MADSNQAVVQSATAALKVAIEVSSDFANWVGWEALQNGATLEQALNIVHAIEDGNYSLNDLFIAAQSKTPGTYAAGINGEPNPTLTVNGQTFEIGHLLGETTVEQWSSGNAKNLQYHSREYFTTVGDDAPKGYVEGWDNPNHAPTAAAAVDAVFEDSSISGSVIADDTDSDSLTFSLNDTAPAGLTFNANGTYTFDASNAAYQHLAAGATANVVVNYTVSDGHGGAAVSTLTITVTGSNDAPKASVDVAAVNEDATVTGSVAGNDSDADDSAVLAYSLDAAVPGLKLDSEGNYSFNAGHDAYQHLAAGETAEVVANYTVTDERGGSSVSQLTITVTGTNDAPVVSGAVTGDAAEGGATSTLNALTNASDIDDATTLSVVNVPAQASLPAGVSYDAASQSFTLDPSVGAYNHLAAGATETVSVSYGVSDEHGAITPASVKWTVTGTNDAPVATADTNSGLEDTVIMGSVATNDKDADDGAVLKYSLNAPVAGLTINEDGTYSLDASNTAYQNLHLGDNQVVTANYTVTDEHGASATSTLSITLTGTADQYHGVADLTTSFTKTAVNSGNGNQTAESFHFDLSLPTIEDAFDFSGKVTLTVKGDIDGLNENATATAISGELVDENASEPGLLYLVGTIGNNNDKDATDNGDNVTVSGSTNVGANGFADGHVVFDVAVSGDVDSGAIVSASLSYDYWA